MNVAAKWYLDDEEGIAPARELRRQHRDGALELAGPDCFYYELGNLIRTAERRTPPRITSQRADEIIADVLRLQIAMTPTVFLLPRAFERSRRFGISIYDAFYLSVAELLGATFVTADGPLYDRLRPLPYVRRLDQLG